MGKISRNDRCPCGSNLKYKKCCLKANNGNESIQQLQEKKERSDKLTQSLGKQVIILDLPYAEVKMSEIVLEFADDILQHAMTDSAIHTAIGLACCAWNLALFDAATREKQINRVSGDFGSKNSNANEEARSIINKLIQHKLTYYSHINRYIFDFQLSLSEKNFNLNIVSSILT